ncbi:MAG: YigZ family protein [Dehalococcoidales bacterium]|nr:YigZ family protein [Dehalococcoidales bacterium]
MKTIKKNINNELVINKSRFITFLFKVNDESEIDDFLNGLKKEYKDATHYCYAYIINDVKRSSDDNEPGGTAGIPILSVLESHELNLILCVVVRYFGGVKLGAGGLIRAYRKSVNECLKLSELVTLRRGIIFEVTFNYEDTKDIDYILYSVPILNKVYGETITYRVATINPDILDKLQNYKVKIIKDTLVER